MLKHWCEGKILNSRFCPLQDILVFQQELCDGGQAASTLGLLAAVKATGFDGCKSFTARSRLLCNVSCKGPTGEILCTFSFISVSSSLSGLLLVLLIHIYEVISQGHDTYA